MLKGESGLVSLKKIANGETNPESPFQDQNEIKKKVKEKGSFKKQ